MLIRSTKKTLFNPKLITLSLWSVMYASCNIAYASDEEHGEKIVIEAYAEQRGLQLKTEVATGSRLNLTPMQTPANIEVITGQDIQNRGDQTIREAVTRATGVTSNPTTGNGGTSLVSRGFAGHASVMQLIDGTRLFLASGTITYPFDTWSVDRIEVLHGASSVLYGEGAVGGVINVIPKKPSQRPITNEAQLTVGLHNTYRGAFSSGGAINNQWSYQANIHAGRTDGWMNKGEEDFWTVSGALRFDPTSDLNMTLSYEYAEQNPSIYLGTPLIDGKIDKSIRKKSYQVEDSDIRYRDNWIKFNLEWTPTDTVTVRNNLYYLTSKRLWRTAEAFGWNSTTGLIDVKDYMEIKHDLKQVGNRADISFQNNVFGLNNNFLFGFDANRIEFNPESNSPYGNAVHSFDPNHPSSHYFDSICDTIPRTSTIVKQASIFTENRLELTDKWSLIGGLRYDYFDINRDNLITPENSWKNSFSKVTWRAGTVYEITPNLSLYGQFATAADPFSAIVSTSDAQKSFSLTKAKQYEIGIKQLFWDQRAEWSLAAYKINKKNLWSYDDKTKTSMPVGSQSSKGIELAAGVQILPTVRIDANAAILEARYGEFNQSGKSYNGNVPTSTPQKSANVWVEWEFLPDWTIRPGLRYVGQRYNNAANTQRLPGYSVWDASLEWKMNQNIIWRLHGYNLTDKVYPESAYNSGRQWVLGRPRTAELVVDFKF